MTFFYDKLINIYNGVNLYKTNYPNLPKENKELTAFKSSYGMSDTFGNITSPLDLSEKQIQELVLKNPKIIEIIEKNKLWNY